MNTLDHKNGTDEANATDMLVAESAAAQAARDAETVEQALKLLRADLPMEAHLLLRNEFHRDPKREFWARIANLIKPCEMYRQAEVELLRLEFHGIPPAEPDPVQEYQQNKPTDEEIGRTVPV